MTGPERTELAALRNLLFPELGHPVVDPAFVDADRLARAAQRNRAPLAITHGPQADALRSDPAQGRLIDDHRERLAWWSERFGAVADAWAAEGVPTVLIKAAGFFPYTSDNVDALVPADGVPAAVDALRSLGYRECPSLREPFKRYFKQVRDADSFGLPVHLHTEVAWINRFLPGARVLAGAERLSPDHTFLGPSPADIALITLGHAVYEDKELKLRDVLYAYRAAERGVDWDDLRAMARAWGWEAGWDVALHLLARGIDTLDLKPLVPEEESARAGQVELRDEGKGGTRDSDTSFPLRLPKVWGKLMHFAKTWTDPTLALPARAAETALLARFAAQVKITKYRPPRTVIVAVSGPDGGGKTTLAHDLSARLRDLGVEPAYHWQRAGTSPALTALRRLVRKTRPQHAGTDADDRAGEPQPNAGGRLADVWAAAVAVDLVGRLWWQVISGRVRGGVHIFDRFTVDGAADMVLLYDTDARKPLLRVSPNADLSVLVLPPPQGWPDPPPPDQTEGDAGPVYEAESARFDVVVEQAERDALVRDLAVRVLDLYDPQREKGLHPETVPSAGR
ncbi:MAG: hypothetical protein QOI20_2482 [Acidimicrobiaceae bacterium]|jgi:hypothetical protein|nr:hypothetical protein [Acidimicrobiaceae bacterium]